MVWMKSPTYQAQYPVEGQPSMSFLETAQSIVNSYKFMKAEGFQIINQIMGPCIIKGICYSSANIPDMDGRIAFSSSKYCSGSDLNQTTDPEEFWNYAIQNSGTFVNNGDDYFPDKAINYSFEKNGICIDFVVNDNTFEHLSRYEQLRHNFRNLMYSGKWLDYVSKYFALQYSMQMEAPVITPADETYMQSLDKRIMQAISNKDDFTIKPTEISLPKPSKVRIPTVDEMKKGVKPGIIEQRWFG